jgi:hypothetical protein
VNQVRKRCVNGATTYAVADRQRAVQGEVDGSKDGALAGPVAADHQTSVGAAVETTGVGELEPMMSSEDTEVVELYR